LAVRSASALPLGGSASAAVAIGTTTSAASGSHSLWEVVSSSYGRLGDSFSDKGNCSDVGAKIQRRWPNNAEAARQETIEAADEAIRLLRSARERIKSNPLHSELDIADAMRMLGDIKRMMVEAKQGIG